MNSDNIFQSYKVGEWTDGELDIITKYGATMTAREITERYMMNRWYLDVMDKRYKMGIKVNPETCHKGLWSDDEANILRRHGSTAGYKDLMHLLPNRSRSSIMSKRFTMGITYA